MSRELGIRRTVLYRWRDAYHIEGDAGLSRPPGRPRGSKTRAAQRSPRLRNADEALRERVAELERTIGQITAQLDFFRRAFKRVKESRPTSSSGGVTVSSPKSRR